MLGPQQVPYLIIAVGLGLFAIGLAIDLSQHGIQFLRDEFREAPLAHGLPLAGVALAALGTFLGWRRARRSKESGGRKAP